MFWYNLFYHAARQWLSNDMGYYAAAFSYYAPLALTPIILLSLIVTGFFYGQEFVTGIFQGWGSVLGKDLLALVNVAVANLDLETQSYRVPVLATIFFSGMSIFAFNVLGTAFQKLWGRHETGIIPWVIQSSRSIVFVLILQLYLVSVIAGEGFVAFFHLDSFVLIKQLVWFTSLALVFFLIYRSLAGRPPTWRGCFIGAMVSTVLFIVASNIFNIYFATQPVIGIFGAAGLILVLLVFIYIAACIALYGAAIAHMYDNMSKSNPELK